MAGDPMATAESDSSEDCQETLVKHALLNPLTALCVSRMTEAPPPATSI